MAPWMPETDARDRCLGSCCPFSHGQAFLLGKFISMGDVTAPLQADRLNMLCSKWLGAGKV